MSEAEARYRAWAQFIDDHPELTGGRMSEPEVLPELDEPPRRYVDSHDVIEQATAEEIEKGVRLGREIDPDDDEDNGL